MGRLKSIHILMVVLAVFVAGLVLLMPGCSDPPPPPVYEDKGIEDKSAGEGLTPDTATPDQTPDQPVLWPDIWPDQHTGENMDQYVGAPFGCTSDADCFGQKCCDTPWGVKLCAPTCDVK